MLDFFIKTLVGIVVGLFFCVSLIAFLALLLLL